MIRPTTRPSAAERYQTLQDLDCVLPHSCPTDKSKCSQKLRVHTCRILMWTFYFISHNMLRYCYNDLRPVLAMVFSSLFPYLFFLSTLPLPVQSNSIVCAGDLYGKPLLTNVLTLANTLPYVKTDPDHQMDAGRTFAEPAFFTPKFQGLLNTWDTSMVQMPLIWRFRKSLILSSPRTYMYTNSLFPSDSQFLIRRTLPNTVRHR